MNGEITEKLPSNAGIPKNWAALILWTRDGELENPITYNAKVVLEAPDGTKTVEGEVSFEASNAYLNFRNTINFPIFPVGQSGKYALKLFYKKAEDEDSKFEQVGEFPIHVLHAVTEHVETGSLEIS
ncbi:MAG: hypothetical protein ABI878_09545 [Acidobacteriota bacterium]